MSLLLLPKIARWHRTISRYYDSLFSSGEVGVVLDFQDLSLMFQNLGGTTPVTAVGQSIVSIKDKLSSNLCVFTGTAPTLQFDSTNNVFLARFPNAGGTKGTITVPTSLNGNATKSILTVCTLKGAGTSETPVLYGANATAAAFGLGNGSGYAGLTVFEQGSGHSATGSNAAAGAHLVVGTKNNTALQLYLDSATLYASATATGAANITVNTLNVGYYPSLAGFDFTSDMYSAVLVNRVVTSTEVGNILTRKYR